MDYKTTGGNSEKSAQIQESSPFQDIDGRIKKLKTLIIVLFIAYAAVITILRIMGYGRLVMGFVESYAFRGMRWITVGGWIFTALPLVIAIYAVFTRLGANCRKCIQYFTLLAMLNHVGYFIIFILNYAWVAAISIGYAQIGPPIMLSLIILMLYLFISTRKLGGLEAQKTRPLKSEGSMKTNALPGIAVVLAFIISPTLNFSMPEMYSYVTGFLPFNKVVIIKEEDCVYVSNAAWSIRFSPDGGLMAVGGYGGLTVMDSESKKQLFSDYSINVRSVCFSPDGKYLAAAGESISSVDKRSRRISNDLGGLALYEVDGFRRLENVILPPESDAKRKNLVASAAFRPNGNLLYVYCSYWDTKLLSDEERSELYEREGSLLSWAPICREVDIPSGEILHEERFGRQYLDAFYRFRFSPDGSKLAYIHSFDDKKTFGKDQRNISLVDTQTWEERVFNQDDPKYQMWSLYMDSVDSGKIYFLLQKSERESVFGVLNIEDATSGDIVSSDMALKRYGLNRESLKRSYFVRCAVSPDKKKAALLGTIQESRNQPDQNMFEFYVVIINLEGEPRPRLRRYKLGFEDYAVSYISWLMDNQLTLSAGNSSAMIFNINLDDLEEK
jgi:hypothetical protein